jgi:hypothetical protein
MMTEKKLVTVYVNPQQLQRQQESKEKAKRLVLTPDPAVSLAKAWGLRKLRAS